MSERSRWQARSLVNGLAIVVLLALLVVGGLWQPSGPERADITLVLDPECDLRAGPCVSRVPDGGAIGLGIEPRQIPLLQPLGFRVRLQGLKAQAVTAEITGVNMDMGYNRLELERQDDGSFLGEGVLPVCTQRKMIWQALVVVVGDHGRIAAPFHFNTIRE
jgi:hypothetical protein